MSDTQGHKNQPLSYRIHVTRKARIFAEERLLRYGLLAKLSLVSYALASVVLAVVATTLPEVFSIPMRGFFDGNANDAIRLLSLLIPIVLLPVSALVSAQRFGARALLMRACYVNLALLEEEAKREEAKNEGIARLCDVAQKYCIILSLTENHKEVDFQFHKLKKLDQLREINFRIFVALCYCAVHWVVLLFWGAVGILLPTVIVGHIFWSIMFP